MQNQPLAYLMPEFLQSDEARPIRILAEYFEPLRRFEDQGIRDTVVFFGSARVRSREAATRALAAAERAGGDQAALARARRAVEWSRYYEEARQLAARLTTWSMGLDDESHRFVVCSGGGPGIMEAANRGATEAGGKSIGLNIRLPFEQGVNPWVTRGLHFEFHYFFMRKFWFAYLAKALVVFPGGFGTMDELFELLTLAQTEKLTRTIPIFLYGSEYWDPILNLEVLADWGAIGERDLSLVRRVDTVEEAFEQLRCALEECEEAAEEEVQPGTPALAKTRA